MSPKPTSEANKLDL